MQFSAISKEPLFRCGDRQGILEHTKDCKMSKILRICVYPPLHMAILKGITAGLFPSSIIVTLQGKRIIYQPVARWRTDGFMPSHMVVNMK